MSIHLRTIRTVARHGNRLLPLVVLLLASAGSLGAQALQPVSVNGRTVWTNDTPPAPVARPAHAVQPSKLFYWSDSEHRWKPVRPATPSALRSARVVASEVSSYIESKPLLNPNAEKSVKGELASHNPNYTVAANDRSVSAADIDRFINDAAARHHVDPNLVRALVEVESNFNPRAVSSKGAMGLMQLMPETARMYDVHNPFDAAQNVDAGVRHLKGLLDDFGGDVTLSLAAYNAGQGAVKRSGGIPPYTETRNYVKRITNLMSSNLDVHFSNLSIPIQIRRDERGRLVISNTD